MVGPSEHSVGLRELRHQTGEVLARVRGGETVDVTERGRLVARIVPVAEQAPPTALRRLEESGRLRRATRPGYRPTNRRRTDGDLLTDALAALRDEESW
ncbi:MAG TPA: type II toxin-antitoxin system prevent-host-death family antitoxin [Nocardioidaceae bacterium]|nr:type II toxin-antitoxin system prevent-host-death family antitoxin [Nocardioidaceae bacterium]